MKRKTTLFASILAIMMIVNLSLSQDNSDWRWRSVTTQANVMGNYNLLPQQDGFRNPTATTKKIQTQQGDVLVPPNVRPLPQAVTTESEETIVTQYGNQNVMYGAWNSYGPSFYGTGFCITTNGGTSWTGNTQMIVSGNNGDPGPWIWSTGSTWPGRLGISVIGSAGISATYSTDNGSTWTPFVNAGGSSTDKNLSAVDETTGSPFLGRAYTVWTDFGGTYVNRIVGAYTSNGGVSWTGYQPVSPVPPSGHHMQGCDVAVGPGGVVYVVWATCTTNGQNSTEDFLGFAKSTDGGVTWPVSNYNVVDINGIRAANLFNGIRASGFPRLAVDHSGGARNGWVYVTLAEKLIAPARDNSDVCFCRSTDGGTTWTHTLVNSDPASSTDYNYMSSICVDQTNGLVGIGYYDQRNTVNPVTQFYVSFSNNGGNTWTDVQASDHNFTPSPIPGLAGGYQGDYTGITYSNGKLFPFWCDNSSGVYNVWTCALNPVTLTHDWSAGPFLSFPQGPILINVAQNIKTRIANLGTTNETAVPVKFFINGTLTNTTNKDLVAGQVDSVNNAWTPTAAGTYNFMYVVALATDQDRTNDTVRASINVVTSLPPICESFNNATFPPTGWTVGGSSTYWSRATQSAYGVGSGSAMWDNYSAPNGSRGTMTSLTFPATTGVDSIHFAMAYCQWAAYPNDSLIIWSSTNGGSTFSLIVRMGEPSMNTASGSCTHPFTPVNTDWGRRAFLIPVGTNKIQFEAYSGFGDHLYLDSIGTNQCWNYVGITTQTSEIPTTYSLAQNYPNPFNPVTKINFALPKSGLVKITVFDVLGREVAIISNEVKPAGYQSVVWDASNFPSGVYFYKIEAGSFVDSKKMVLVK